MPLSARSFLPYTLPGVLALIGLWWYSWRKKEQINRDDSKQEKAIGLPSSPEEGAGKTVEATRGVTYSEGSNSKEPEPGEQEVVAHQNTLTTSSSAEAALGTPLVVVESVKLSCHGIAARDSQQRSPERASQKPDSCLTTTSSNCIETTSHQKRPETATVSHELVKEFDTSPLLEQSWDQTLNKQNTDSVDVLAVVGHTLELVKADRPEPEGDNVLAVQFSEHLQDSLSSTKNEFISFTPKTLDLYAPVMSQQSLCTASRVLLPSCPVSTSSPISNDSAEVPNQNQNGDLRHPADKSNSMDELHCLAASLITEVLSSAAREVTAVSCCESLLRETPEEAHSRTPALNGTKILKDECVCQVSSTSQNVPDQLVQHADKVREVITFSVCAKSEMQGSIALDDQQERLESRVQAQGEIETATQNSGSIVCQSESGIIREDLPSTCLSASLLANTDEMKCFSHSDQQTLLKSALLLPTVQLQEDTIGTEDRGYSMCQLENGISSEDHLSTDFTAAVPDSKEDSFTVSVQQQQLEFNSNLFQGQSHEETVTGPEDSGCSMSSEDILSTGLPSTGVCSKEKQDSFALADQLVELESTSVLPNVQTQEETVTGTEDSGCSTCQSEDGISTEDLLSTGLSSAEPDAKRDLIQTSGILVLKEKEDGLQVNSDKGELEKPTLSTKPALTNCASAQLNGVEALRNGTNEAEADQSGGSDVNSMDSMDSCLNLGEDSQQSGSQSTELIVWEIEVPRHLVGRLIGKKGRYVSFLKQTSGAKIYISTLPYTQEFQICHIEGSQQQVDKALTLIGKKFKDLDLTNVYAPQSLPLTMPSLSITSWLLLPTGVAVEVIVVNIVSAGHVFVQQHTHPTYHALRSLDQQMFLCYSQPGTPALPSPAEVGVICAAPVIDGAWWRAQVISFYKDSDEVEIRYVDYGGYERVKMDTLRQIRSDFVTLPFQGTEVLLDNITPLPGEDQFSTDANSALEEMTQGLSLLAQVTNYDNNTGLPLVQMWSMVGEELVLLNRTLADRGLATWVDSF